MQWTTISPFFHTTAAAYPEFSLGEHQLQKYSNLLFGQISPKTAWKWRQFDRERGVRPKFYYVDPLLCWKFGLC